MPKERQVYKKLSSLEIFILVELASCGSVAVQRLLRKFVTAYLLLSPFRKVVLGSGGKNQEESVLGIAFFQTPFSHRPKDRPPDQSVTACFQNMGSQLKVRLR